jgi:hypothetical protein
MAATKTTVIFFNADKKLARQLERLARLEGITRAELLRQRMGRFAEKRIAHSAATVKSRGRPRR